MGLLSIYEIIRIVRKYILKATAAALAVGVVAFFVISSMQTYTCVLNFKYNHAEALEGLAPDGESKLDPYEIQNPTVIKGALKEIGYSDEDMFDLKGLRQSIQVSKVVVELDKEISESAALLGEKYEVAATEYEMRFSYKAHLGSGFGAKMFSGIIKSYDEFLLDKYYNKKTVADFTKIVQDTSADYIIIADNMASELDSIVEYLESLGNSYPDFRSKNTGYSFNELAQVYSNMKNIQHAKYYGNIRAANLAKDREMVITSYRAKVIELTEQMNVFGKIGENYKKLVTTYYDSYKNSGLYRQAKQTQTVVNTSNKTDDGILDNYDINEYGNTYDSIVINYAENSSNATDAMHTINHYNSIISSFETDTVDAETKNRYLDINNEILADITALSSKYSKIANETIKELYDTKVTTDLQYLIAPEVVTDVPVKFLTVLVVILAFGGIMIAIIFVELASRLMKGVEAEHGLSDKNDTKDIDISDLSENHQLVYEQYKNGFSEFYLVYQEMVRCKSNEYKVPHYEVYIRWRSAKAGLVSPEVIIDCVRELGLFKELNEWIIRKVCSDITEHVICEDVIPVVHINCPHDELKGFALNDILVKCFADFHIPASALCFELSGREISESIEYIMLLQRIGVAICVDHFEDSTENNEIINVVKPSYVKMSYDILNYDMLATSKDEFINATADMLTLISDVIAKCHENGIEVCVCGVENKAQDRSIDLLDFDYKQGFYYGKPRRLSE